MVLVSLLLDLSWRTYRPVRAIIMYSYCEQCDEDVLGVSAEDQRVRIRLGSLDHFRKRGVTVS